MFAIDYRIDSSAVNIVTTALYANGTWLTMLPTLLAGGTLVIMENFDAVEFLELVQKRSVPTRYGSASFRCCWNNPDLTDYDISSMRIWNSAGSPLRAATRRK